MADNPRPFREGEDLSASRLNEWSGYVSGSTLDAGEGLESASGTRRMLAVRSARPIVAKLSGASSPYSWTSQANTAAGTYANHAITGTTNAYEVNGVSGLNNKVVRLYPDGRGKWNFQYLNCCGGGACSGTFTVTIAARCNGTTLVTGATVTISQGGVTVASGTTNAFGNFATTALTSAGTYDLTVARSGYATYTGTFTFACANQVVTASMITASNTISGTTLCTTGTFPGVTVTVKSSPSGAVLGSTVSGGGGAWSITVSGYSTHSYTLTFSEPNYTASITGVLTMSCTGTTNAGSGGPAVPSGKTAQCTCLVADSSTLTFSSSGYSTTLTYDGPTWSAYVGYLTVNCRAITGLGCAKSNADVTLMIRYSSATCSLLVTFQRQGRSSAACTGTGGIDLPASDAWCTSISGLGSGACSDIFQYLNGSYSLSSTTGYPFVATYSGVLFRDADGNPFLTNATVSE